LNPPLLPQRTPTLVFLAGYGRDLCAVLKRALESEGYRVAHSVRDADAFRQILALRPDVIVGELMLPGWQDGERLLLALRADPRTRPIPIIVTSWSAEALERTHAEVEQLGIEVLREPFDLDEFLERVAFYAGPGVRPRRVA
jgi:CheY-like chemotaxis protein